MFAHYHRQYEFRRKDTRVCDGGWTGLIDTRICDGGWTGLMDTRVCDGGWTALMDTRVCYRGWTGLDWVPALVGEPIAATRATIWHKCREVV